MMEMSPLLTSPIMFWRRNLIASKSEICRPTFPPLLKSWFINVVFNLKSGIAMNHAEGLCFDGFVGKGETCRYDI